MCKRIIFASVLTTSLVAALVVACGSESAPGASPGDGEAGALGAETSQEDGSAPEDSAGMDAPVAQDAAADGAEAGPVLPSLCKTYPDTLITFDNALLRRWYVIAYRAMELAAADCAITTSFETFIGPGSSNPDSSDCLTAELRALAECPGPGGSTVVYDATSKDQNNDACLPAVTIGFKNGNPSAKDVERFVTRVKDAALEIGLAGADAARLEALLLAKKATAVKSASSGYTDSTCDGGI